jgi:hypothetical protein
VGSRTGHGRTQSTDKDVISISEPIVSQNAAITMGGLLKARFFVVCGPGMLS